MVTTHPTWLLQGPVCISEVIINTEAHVEAQPQPAHCEAIAARARDDLGRTVRLCRPHGAD
eukprot:scaffold28228_cov37-Tisochrysis_lutea.AAC.3